MTAVLGTLELPFFPWRWYLLAKNGGERSSIPDLSNLDSKISSSSNNNLTRSQKFKKSLSKWDVFQWEFLLGIILEATLLTVACSVNGDFGDFNLLCLSVPALWLMIGFQMITSILLNKFQIKSPYRLSSRPSGSVIEPALFYVWQDLTAVDGAGTNTFRKKFETRYDTSMGFRKLLEELTLIMGVGLILVFPLVAVVIYLTPEDRMELIWGTTMGINVVWLGIVATLCIWWVRRGLRQERQGWRREQS